MENDRNSEFSREQLVGEGTYGKVYRVVRKSTGKTYALKEISLANRLPREREEAVNEIRLLASVRHVNIVKYRESFCVGDNLCIVTDFADRGDLSQLLKVHRKKGQRLPESSVWAMFIQVARAVEYLHSMHILHRDIKCSNVFLTGPAPLVKLGDLGVAKLLRQSATQTQVGTPFYISPEIWRKEKYNEKSDVWSVGCVLYEMCTLRHPFVANAPKELARKVLTGRFTPVNVMCKGSKYSQEVVSLIDRLLCVDTRARPTMRAVLAMPAVVAKYDLVPEEGRPKDIALDGSNPLLEAPTVMQTIRIPRNLAKLPSVLPPPSYATPGTVMKSKKNDEPEKKIEVVPFHMEDADMAAAPADAEAAPVERKDLLKATVSRFENIMNLTFGQPDKEKKRKEAIQKLIDGRDVKKPFVFGPLRRPLPPIPVQRSSPSARFVVPRASVAVPLPKVVPKQVSPPHVPVPAPMIAKPFPPVALPVAPPKPSILRQPVKPGEPARPKKVVTLNVPEEPPKREPAPQPPAGQRRSTAIRSSVPSHRVPARKSSIAPRPSAAAPRLSGAPKRTTVTNSSVDPNISVARERRSVALAAGIPHYLLPLDKDLVRMKETDISRLSVRPSTRPSAARPSTARPSTAQPAQPRRTVPGPKVPPARVPPARAVISARPAMNRAADRLKRELNTKPVLPRWHF